MEGGIGDCVGLFRGAGIVHRYAHWIDALVHVVAARTIVEVRFCPTFPVAFAPITNLYDKVCARRRMLRAHMHRARRIRRRDKTNAARATSGAVARAKATEMPAVTVQAMPVRGGGWSLRGLLEAQEKLAKLVLGLGVSIHLLGHGTPSAPLRPAAGRVAWRTVAV